MPCIARSLSHICFDTKPRLMNKTEQMTRDEIRTITKVPEPTLRRLPWYLAFVKLLRGKGETVISSTQISKEINVDSSQVAKDLSFVNATKLMPW